MGAVQVRVVGGDPVTDAAVGTCLRRDSRVRVLAPEHGREAEVVLVLAFQVREPCLAAAARAVREAARPFVPVLVVADEADPRALSQPSASTVWLRREDLLPQDVAQALVDIGAAARGGAGTMRGALSAEPARRASRARGQLDAREREVVRLLAEGFSTAEMAARLHYSERTIKAVIRTLLTRHGLRNRPHAVAHALRTKAL